MKRILTTLSQKWPEYLLEMIVITVGILGAYRLNNWHEGRKDQVEAESVTRNLNFEFKKNQDELIKTIENMDQQFQSGSQLMDFIGKEKELIDQYNMDSLLFFALDATLYTPSQYALSDLSNAGRWQLLKNENLKELIYQWRG